MKLRANRTSIAMERRNMLVAATGRTAIVRMAEIVVGAVDGPAVADGIVDAAGAVDGRAAVADEIADAAGRAGEGTKRFCRGFARI